MKADPTVDEEPLAAGLMEVSSQQELDQEADPVGKDVDKLLAELRQVQTKVRQAMATAKSAPAPGFPEGSAPGSLEPLAGPLGDMTWKLAKHAQRLASRGGALSTVDEIENVLDGFLKGGVDEVQKKIDDLLKRVQDLALSEAKLKPVADANDASLHACRMQQLKMKRTFFSVTEALAALKDEKEKVCAQREKTRV